MIYIYRVLVVAPNIYKRICLSSRNIILNCFDFDEHARAQYHIKINSSLELIKRLKFTLC